MIGHTRDESSIRFQKQVHVKRESHELEEEDGAYVSKQVRCIAYHLTSQASHICFADISRNKTPHGIQQDIDELKFFLIMSNMAIPQKQNS